MGLGFRLCLFLPLCAELCLHEVLACFRSWKGRLAWRCQHSGIKAVTPQMSLPAFPRRPSDFNRNLVYTLHHPSLLGLRLNSPILRRCLACILPSVLSASRHAPLRACAPLPIGPEVVPFWDYLILYDRLIGFLI